MRIQSRILLYALVCVLVALAGCNLTGPTYDQPRADKNLEPASPGWVVINGHIVSFEGRVFADGETTFSYTIIPASWASPMETLVMEVPSGRGDPVDFAPPYGVVEDLIDFGLRGLIWRAEASGEPVTVIQDSFFSVTYAGDVPLGTVQALVEAGGETGVGTIYGPEMGPAEPDTVSGTVFVDTDRDGVRDPATEPGLPDVVVEIVAADGTVGTATTDADGFWSAATAGPEVTVRVDTEAYPEAANASLADYYDATTPLSYTVVLDGDESGIDFGFAPQTAEIISAIETGALPTNGEDRKFWRAQFKRALVRAHRPNDNGTGPGQVYDNDQLLAFAEAIQDLYYEDPFVFTPGRELREIYNILQFKPATLLDELRQELLVTELNHVAHLGLWATNPQFQSDIIGWGESVVIQETAAAGDKAALDIQRAIGVFKAINTGGGGIIDD